MAIVVRRAFPRSYFPNDFAAIAIDGDDFERVLLIRANAVGMQKHLAAFDRMRHRFRTGHYGSFDRRRQEYTVAPNDRRRMRAAVNRGLPLDVFGWRPFGRKVFLIRDAGAIRSAPLRPIPGGCFFRDKAQPSYGQSDSDDQR